MNRAAIAQIARDVARTDADAPRYRQIIDALVCAIEHGALTPGERVPPETDMAELFSVRPRTSSSSASATRTPATC
jgi:DNA-binding transcriptional regulator YhcF (GntR family)